jgi:SPP1 gp7 family putative phage head morphogenesis protein
MRQVIASESIRTVPGLDIADIGRRIMDRAHRLVTDALASGESTDRLAQRLVDLGATTASRASAVARTALMSASNNAAVVTFRESESVAGLRWVATFDERTCPLCGALHGSEYKADDPALPPMPAHFNCRCVWLPVFVDAGLNDAVEAEFTQAVGELEAGAPLRSSGAFDSWLRSADATVRADFFPSVLKRAAFESGHFGVRDLIASDGDVVTDEQLMRTLRRMGIDRKVQRAAESILSGLSK